MKTGLTLIIDNYDSFTYNLAEQLRRLGSEVVVRRNDVFTAEEVESADRILLSPGPGIPAEAGNMADLIKSYIKKKPMLGICLGHQAIIEHFEGSIYNMERVYHGIADEVRLLEADPIFALVKQRFTAGRYHSWASKSRLPKALAKLAETADGTVMAIKHRSLPVYGFQFHPESVLTPEGDLLMQRWLELTPPSHQNYPSNQNAKHENNTDTSRTPRYAGAPRGARFTA